MCLLSKSWQEKYVGFRMVWLAQELVQAVSRKKRKNVFEKKRLMIRCKLVQGMMEEEKSDDVYGSSVALCVR